MGAHAREFLPMGAHDHKSIAHGRPWAVTNNIFPPWAPMPIWAWANPAPIQAPMPRQLSNIDAIESNETAFARAFSTF